jgi:hypothetical protein
MKKQWVTNKINKINLIELLTKQTFHPIFQTFNALSKIS